MDTLMGNTLFLMRGEKWRKMRKTLTPAFKMRHMFDLVRECASISTDFLFETFFTAVGSEMSMEMKDFCKPNKIYFCYQSALN